MSQDSLSHDKVFYGALAFFTVIAGVFAEFIINLG